jgi:hypothetical protein
VEGIDTATHNTLVANADVVSPPAVLDQAIGAGNLAAVQSAIESIGLPGNWIVANNTYRQVARALCWMFRYFQRHNGLGNTRILTGGVTLDTVFNTLPLGVRNALIATAQSFSFDTSSLSSTNTIRQILKALSDQVSTIQVDLGGVGL